MNERKTKAGILSGILTYTLWGFIPLFFKLLSDVLPMEILSQRIIWASVFMLIAVVLSKKWQSFVRIITDLFRHPKKLLMMLLVSLLISTNWFTFIWAINNNHILQTSLGYYINPIISILLGVIFLKEKLARAQVIAVVLAFIGVMVMTLSLGAFPYISLTLALSFGFYGLLKKKMDYAVIEGLAVETLFVTPFALIAWFYFINSDQSFVTNHATLGMWALVVSSGIVTAVPLLLFAFTARNIPLSMMGFMQYIGPTISLLLGVLVYHEAFTVTHAISFSLIWLGLIVFSVATFKMYRVTKL
ncbi:MULTISPECIES: EamA family transporter RarD [Brochothrix]|uniref:Protein RarD n=1 Tax=Brochothrix thermosphacta TaxID=2756 RepID=A0A1D2KI92_BROTH|nr:MULTISPECIES: EamA family transporter RarD [Brochothrix]SLM96265.1 RarD protein [Brachybacterium faecium]ANZ97908.1 transporter [Brochothrix thermosphacta]ATF25111.1 protein RarD [Brochothrix thermosphacta]ATH84494.1 protein RarD [Brochothrix thermosphacta]MBR5526726.1 EamA family transporter RarD [Brochothrix sp.]